MTPLFENQITQPFSLEKSVEKALTHHDSLQLEILLSLGHKKREIQKIADKIGGNRADQQTKINLLLKEVTVESKSQSKKDELIQMVLNKIFTLSDPVKAEEDILLFLSAGGNFHNITEYLNTASVVKDLPLFLDIVRRTIRIEQAILKGHSEKSILDSKFKGILKDPDSSHQLQKTTAFFTSCLKFYNVQMLHLSCTMRLNDLAEEVINCGVDVNSQHSTLGMTPLHRAAWSGDVNLMSLLLSKGANVESMTFEQTNAKKGKETPLHIAASRGHFDAVQLLLSHNADAKAISAEGKTPLDYARESGSNNDVIKLLLKWKAK